MRGRNQRETVTLPQQQIRIECVNLTAAWPQIERRRQAIIEEYP